MNDLLPSPMVPEDNETPEDTEVYGSIDPEGATIDSDPIIGIGISSDAAHSTVIIKTPHFDTSGTILYFKAPSYPIKPYLRYVASLLFSMLFASCNVCWWSRDSIDSC